VNTRRSSLKTWHSKSISPILIVPLNIEKGKDSSADFADSLWGSCGGKVSSLYLAHRVAIAFLAIALRSDAVKTFARAMPPFAAPSFDNLFAASVVSFVIPLT
jgi:hypothetical protein